MTTVHKTTLCFCRSRCGSVIKSEFLYKTENPNTALRFITAQMRSYVFASIFFLWLLSPCSLSVFLSFPLININHSFHSPLLWIGNIPLMRKTKNNCYLIENHLYSNLHQVHVVSTFPIPLQRWEREASGHTAGIQTNAVRPLRLLATTLLCINVSQALRYDKSALHTFSHLMTITTLYNNEEAA